MDVSKYVLIMVVFTISSIMITKGTTYKDNTTCILGDDKFEKMILSTLAKTDTILKENQMILHKTYGLLEYFMKWEQDQLLHNVALGKYAEQSSSIGSVYSASKAVDGYTLTYSHTRFEKAPYLLVDLAHTYLVKLIEIVNRGDCCGDRLKNVDVAIGSSLNVMALCAYYQGPGKDKEHIVLNCETPLSGRFVKLAMRGGTGILQIAELKVFAHRPY